MTLSFSNAEGAEHPAVAQSRATLEALEHRTPPGYPLGYLLEHTRIVCGGCGSINTTSRLFVRYRRGANGAELRPTGANEVVYALRCEERTVHGGTARCASCINTLARTALEPLPEAKAYLRAASHTPEAGVDVDLAALGLL